MEDLLSKAEIDVVGLLSRAENRCGRPVVEGGKPLW